MKQYQDTMAINLAFIGHGDSGKTTLADAILFKSSATSRLGSVDEGTSILDFDPIERERRHSVDLAIASFGWNNRTINILDTPGYPDFVGEAVCALAACDIAVVCINAISGIMVNTRKMWQRATQAGLPKIIMLTKLDLPEIDLIRLITSIQEVFGRNCIPLYLPAGTGPGMEGVLNVITDTDRLSEDLGALAKEAKERLVESDDRLLEEYLEKGSIDLDALEKALPQAIARGEVIPILCSSAKTQIGIKEFLEFITKYLSGTLRGVSRKGVDPRTGSEISRDQIPQADLSGQVFKSISDPFVGSLSYIRIYSGTLSSDAPLFNQRTGRAERIGGLFKPFGKEQRAVREVHAGDIACVTKVEDLAVSDTICVQHAPIKYPMIPFPTPMVSLAVEPKSRADEQRLSTSLQSLSSSDPTFKVMRDRETLELVITGISQLHIDIMLERLKRRYEVQLNTKPPKIPYKETITIPCKGHHKHKKQTGGRGQYGEVYLNIEPLPRGEGFKFVDKITQGRIPNQYIPAVEKGVKEVIEKGVIAGYHVVDVQVTLYDGSYHEVDSSEASFKIAAWKAFRAGFKEGKPVLLEPIVNMEVVVPARFMGDITGDLNSRRGRITGMDTQQEMQVIRATVPLSEVINYSTQLRSITAGEGSYTIEFSHYDIVPHKLAESIIARAKEVEPEEG